MSKLKELLEKAAQIKEEIQKESAENPEAVEELTQAEIEKIAGGGCSTMCYVN